MSHPSDHSSALMRKVEQMGLANHQATLRLWSRADVGFMARARADDAIRRYNGDHDRRGNPRPPPSVQQAAALIDGYQASWQSFARSGVPDGVVFLVADTSTGEPVGCCGVDDWTAEDVAQVGYWIAPEARRHRYATAALTLLTRWLFDLQAERVFLTVVAGNEGSAAVARGAGFLYEGTMRSHSVWQGQRRDVLWFAALATEWTTPQGGASSPISENQPVGPHVPEAHAAADPLFSALGDLPAPDQNHRF